MTGRFSGLSWAQKRKNYEQLATDMVDKYGWSLVQPLDFAHALFDGHLDPNIVCDDGIPDYESLDGLGRGMLLELDAREGEDSPRVKKHHFNRDNLDEKIVRVTEASLQANSALYMAPVTYFGDRHRLQDVRQVLGLAIDIDYITPKRLMQLMWQTGFDVNGKNICQLFGDTYGKSVMYNPPDYIVLSGTGLHAYYVFPEPLPAYPTNLEALGDIKKVLTQTIWNRGVVGDEGVAHIQYQGISQPMRFPGSATKLNGGFGTGKSQAYVALAFANPNKSFPPTTRVEELLDGRVGHTDYAEIASGSPTRERRLNQYLKSHKMSVEDRQLRNLWYLKPVDGRLYLRDPLKPTLAEAKEKWPEWYQKRIVEGIPASNDGGYVASKKLWDWWMAYCLDKGLVGGRYYTVYATCCYGLKCGLPDEEIRDGAELIGSVMQFVDCDPTEEFTDRDIQSAIESALGTKAARQAARRHTAAWIAAKTHIPIRQRKSMGLDKEQQFMLAQDARDKQYPNGSWRAAGRPVGARNKSHKKKEQVKAYFDECPEASIRTAAADLGFSTRTIVKWKKVLREEGALPNE